MGSPGSLERPRLWIVAGPNGSGKSTLYEIGDIDDFGRAVWIINPDKLSARLVEAESLEGVSANMSALDRIRAWLEVSIAAYQTIGVETVLSTDKYRSLVVAAKSRGYDVRLLYVLLRDVELNIARVRLRAQRGGHDVPVDKIRSRRVRSLEQLQWFFHEAEQALVFDNSGAEPQLLASKRPDRIWIDPSAPDEIRRLSVSV